MVLWATIILGLVLTGCSTTGTASLKDLPPDWPPIGTSKADVRARLGPPTSQSVTLLDGQQQEVWGYHYATAQVSPLLWVPVVGLIVAASGESYHADTRGLSVTFNGAGNVIGRSWATQTLGSSPAAPTDEYIK